MNVFEEPAATDFGGSAKEKAPAEGSLKLDGGSAKEKPVGLLGVISGAAGFEPIPKVKGPPGAGAILEAAGPLAHGFAIPRRAGAAASGAERSLGLALGVVLSSSSPSSSSLLSSGFEELSVRGLFVGSPEDAAKKLDAAVPLLLAAENADAFPPNADEDPALPKADVDPEPNADGAIPLEPNREPDCGEGPVPEVDPNSEAPALAGGAPNTPSGFAVSGVLGGQE